MPQFKVTGHSKLGSVDIEAEVSGVLEMNLV
jgi:hypothetical protein